MNISKPIIMDVKGREIFDSRGQPTIEVEVLLQSGALGRMMVPAGASTGIFEAKELRDNSNRLRGKGVTIAVNNVNYTLRKLLMGKSADAQEYLDDLMIQEDGTPDKSGIGANAILGVSIALARAAANHNKLPFFRYLANKYLNHKNPELCIPVPMANIISGGMHAGGNIEIQDFLIIPIGAIHYSEALEMISNVYFTTRDLLNEKGYNAYLLADEGGFGPQLSSNQDALDILMEVFSICGYIPGTDVAIALDIAASTFYNPENKMYHLKAEKRSYDTLEWIDKLVDWTNSYPIVSIEDGLAQDDWEGWQLLTNKLGSRIQLVGDDLFVTNTERIQKGIDLNVANAVLIKMNQVGTLTETIKAFMTSKHAGYENIISARSGETEDNVLADLAVGLNARQIKIGSFSGSSRLSKYNQLIRICEEGQMNFGNKYLSFKKS